MGTVTGDTVFIEKGLSLESYWPAIVLCGLNVASDKFALAETLLERPPQVGDYLRLDELAEPSARHISEHLKGYAA